MKAKGKKLSNSELDELFQKTAEQIRGSDPDPTVVRGAADRVWAKLSSEGMEATSSAAPSTHIRGCDDFRGLIPAYLTGSLSEARRMLFEDHTHECVSCRKALIEARHGARPGVEAYRKTSNVRPFVRPVVRWAIAATVVIAAGLFIYERLSRVSDAFNTIVYAMDGPVLSVGTNDTRTLTIGDKVAAGEKIRCAKDAGAVMKLPDGTLIEMRERSEFSVTRNSGDTTIHLDRGNVIVQAAKQRDGHHLFVQTGDCIVSVKGTIFSVNSGIKGSRVSVIEGKVHVEHAGREDVLEPGAQVTTSTAIERVPVTEEVSWSRDREKYTRMLAEVAVMKRDIDDRAPMPEVRYSTRLLDMSPANTVIYVAIPNISATLRESQKIIDERLAQNAELRDWWLKEQSAGGRHDWNQIITKVVEFGDYLGDEIVVAAGLDSKGEPDGPLVLSTVKDAAAFRAYAQQQISSLTASGKKAPSIRFVDDVNSAGEVEKSDLYAWINGDLLLAAPRMSLLKDAASGHAGFSQTSFYSRLAEVYHDGAGFLIGADLEHIIGAHRSNGKESAAMKQLGILDLKHFIVEIKDEQGKPANRPVLSFNPSDHGIASWLAAPGPMGALQFISPDANVVAAFVVKNPSALVDDLLNAINAVDPNLQQHLAQFQSQTGLNIRDDLAAPLGGEFAFAVDGPVLPTPSWKLVFEVYDPSHLQTTIERLV